MAQQGAGASAAQMITQLEAARKLALADSQVYKQILPGIMPIIGPTALLEVRRWGADFLAEGFASPALPSAQKEEIVTQILPTLRSMLEVPGEDAMVTKSVVQAATSLYPLVFRRVIAYPDQALLWQDMTAIKLNILSRMDKAPPAVRICCTKFIQKVVQVQTPGVIADPRRPERNETSIALVPRNHPILQLMSLEAEASGLLDRLLSVFQDASSEPLMIDATMNCLSILIRSRQAIANKIISAILNFNPLKLANSPMTPRTMVIVRSMERTTRALLRNVNKHNPNGPLAPKIDAYLQRLNQSRAALFSEAPSLKRPAPAEPIDGLEDAKRLRLTGGARKFPPMPQAPNTFAHLFTLTEDPSLQAFDVKLLPVDMVNTIAAVLLQHIDSTSLDEAIGAVRGRYTHLQKVNMPTPIPDVPMAGPTGIDDDDDYDPEYDPGIEAITARATKEVLQELAQPAIELGPFELPKPPPLTKADVTLISHQTVNRVFEVVTSLEHNSQVAQRQKLGINRLAASTNDRDAWVTMMTRLATRAPAGLDELVGSGDEFDGDQEMIKSEADNGDTDKPTLANSIRQTLYMYILEDFRPRLNVAISWLSEEWYADKIQAKLDEKSKSLPNYYRWTLRLLDHFLPYLDARDKNILIRFVSEIPAIDEQILERVKSLARDPERVGMCVMALQYLLLMRPPVRELVLDTIESLWRDPDLKEAKAGAAKVLMRWRPDVLKEGSNGNGLVKKDETRMEERERDGKMAVAKAMMNGLSGKSASPVTKFEPDRVDPRKRVTSSTPNLAVGGDSE